MKYEDRYRRLIGTPEYRKRFHIFKVPVQTYGNWEGVVELFDDGKGGTIAFYESNEFIGVSDPLDVVKASEVRGEKHAHTIYMYGCDSNWRQEEEEARKFTVYKYPAVGCSLDFKEIASGKFNS